MDKEAQRCRAALMAPAPKPAHQQAHYIDQAHREEKVVHALYLQHLRRGNPDPPPAPLHQGCVQ